MTWKIALERVLAERMTVCSGLGGLPPHAMTAFGPLVSASKNHHGDTASLIGSKLRHNLILMVRGLPLQHEADLFLPKTPTDNWWLTSVALVRLANEKELVIAPQKSSLTQFISDTNQTWLHPHG